MWLLKPGTGGCPGPLYSEICSFSHNFTRNGQDNFVMITGSRAAAGGASFRRVACGFRANCIVSLWGENRALRKVKRAAVIGVLAAQAPVRPPLWLLLWKKC